MENKKYKTCYFSDWNWVLRVVTIVWGLAVMGVKNTALAQNAHDNLSDSVVVALWEGNAPFSKSDKPEKTLPSKGDNVIRITNISNPTMTIYPTQNSSEPKPAMLICPGGGYQILAINLEGTEIASWAKSLGFTPVVLKYRVPDQRKAAFADIQRAMSMLRGRAGDWNIDPDKIGVIGFSAGGNLAARLSTHYQNRIYEAVDKYDHESIRPDFSILIYPAYLVNKKDKLEADVKIDDLPPPTFFTQAEDDPIGYRNSLFFYRALANRDVPAELNLFAKGGHGYGLRIPDSNPLSTWPQRCGNWLRSISIIK